MRQGRLLQCQIALFLGEKARLQPLQLAAWGVGDKVMRWNKEALAERFLAKGFGGARKRRQVDREEAAKYESNVNEKTATTIDS